MSYGYNSNSSKSWECKEVNLEYKTEPYLHDPLKSKDTETPDEEDSSIESQLF